jgi:hypothetical protein
MAINSLDYWHLILDFETLSLKPTAKVIQSAMAGFSYEFTEDGLIAKDEFLHSTLVNPATQPASAVDGATTLWWQDQQAKGNMVAADAYQIGVPAEQAANDIVGGIVSFVEKATTYGKSTLLWCKGKDFDWVVLKHFVESYAGEDALWQLHAAIPYYNVHELRTVNLLTPATVLQRIKERAKRSTEEYLTSLNWQDKCKQHDAVYDAVYEGRILQDALSYLTNGYILGEQ